MAAKPKSDSHLEIASVLFIDVVGYSKLLVNEQRAVIEELNQLVRKTPQVRKSDAAGKLIRIPAGDGMSLVFFQTPEEPVQCAMEIAKALKNRPNVRLRMGVHSGPVDQIKDVNDRINVAGAGINIAQRVMSCGDAGHILVSKRVADDLAQDRLWQPLLHDLGEIEVKHGAKLAIVNLYTSELGNSQLPQKLRAREGPRQAPMMSSHAAPDVPDKSIAVLPFESLSADPNNTFFADAIQDEILTDLAKIADLKVISRTSVMQYKSGTKRNLREIANELSVAHVLEGSVQRAANRVRVTAQLIDAKTDTHLWVNSYDRPLDDVFAIQSDIAKAIAAQLQAKLSVAEKTVIEKPPTTNLIAYDRYLRAKKLWAQQTTQPRKDIHEIIRLLDQAVANDPTFLLAYCELARTHAYLYFLGYDHTPARITLAEQARNTALRLGPDRGEPHLAAAWVAYWCYRDYETALTEVEIVRSGLPNDASVIDIISAITRRQGHWDQCIRNFERAIELDPRNLSLLGGAGFTYEYERRFSEAAAYWDRALAVAPDDPTMPVLRTRVDLEARADTQPRHEAIQSVLTKDPSAVDRIADQWFDLALCRREAEEMASALASLPPEGMISGVAGIVAMPRSFLEGLAARVRRDSTGAEKAFTAARLQMEKIVREQPDYAAAVCGLGMIDAALGRKEDAIREGRRAVELLPVTKDAMAGAELLANLAVIYAWVGEKELALRQLEEVILIPSLVCYGRLRLDPFWDPLRGDPRFEKLVEEAKKPVALEAPRSIPAGIAVLPFENLSADPENAFFADGVQDEILNNLAKIADLKVISRTSAMQYKSGANRNLRQIANELGVAHVVEGSVQRADNRVRVSAQLIDAKTDTHSWAESYDRPLG